MHAVKIQNAVVKKMEGACAVYSEDLRYRDMYMARPVQDPRMKTSDCHPGGQVSDFDDGQMYIL